MNYESKPMKSIIEQYLNLPGVFFRFRMLKSIPDLLGPQAAGIMKNDRMDAFRHHNYRRVQQFSEKLDELDRCRWHGIESALFGSRHHVDPDLALDIPDGLLAELHSIENRGSPVAVSEKINRLDELINRISPSRYPYLWAELLQKFCAALLQEKSNDPLAHIQRIIKCCNQVLEVYQREVIPFEWARIQNYLGVAYKTQAGIVQDGSLEISIRHYHLALSVFTHSEHPVNHAITLMNLATAVLGNRQGDFTENTEQAIQHLEQAHSFILQAQFPIYLATIRMNLATAMKRRLTGDRRNTIEQAIVYLKKAMTVLTRKTVPREWSMIQMNLANAYLEPELRSNDAHIEKAIRHYHQAMEIQIKTNFPLGWARINANLAVAWAERKRGFINRNIEKSIHHCQEALSVFKPEISPFETAVTQKNLAIALLKSNPGQPSFWDTVSGLLRSALDLLSEECFPRERLEALAALSEIHLGRSQWLQAVEIFEEIRRVDHRIRQQEVTQASGTSRVRITGTMYSRAAYSLAKCGRIEQAAEWLEYGKMQGFRDRMNLDREVFKRLSTSDQDSYRCITDTLRHLMARQQDMDNTGRTLLESASQIRTARKELDTLLSSIRQYEPDIFLEGMNFQEMVECLPESGDTAFLVFNITKYGSFTLVLSGTPLRHDRKMFFNESFRYDNLNEITAKFSELQAELQKFKDRPIPSPDKLRTFFEQQTNYLDNWNRKLVDIMNQVYLSLFENLADYLAQIGIQSLCLITHRELNILPLHLACRIENREPAYLMDRYQVGFSPCFRLLHASTSGKDRGNFRSFLGVADPASDLVWADPEVDRIGEFFDEKLILRGNEATIQALIENAPLFQVVHMSCHGIFDSNDPYQSRLILAVPKVSSSSDPSPDRRPDSAGNWTLTQILRELHLTETRLVVLSTCESGISEFNKLPDEFIGLPAGFLFAGAESVMSSLWSVPDESTYDLMVEFYTCLIEHAMNPSEALAQAQRMLRSRNKTRLPVHWGAFKIIGF